MTYNPESINPIALDILDGTSFEIQDEDVHHAHRTDNGTCPHDSCGKTNCCPGSYLARCGE